MPASIASAPPTELGRRLAAALKERRMNPREAALGAGLPENTLRKLITGEHRRPSPETLRSIARYFSWPEDQALVWAGYKAETHTIAPQGVKPEQRIEEVLYGAGYPEPVRHMVHETISMHHRELEYFCEQFYEAAKRLAGEVEATAYDRQWSQPDKYLHFVRCIINAVKPLPAEQPPG